MERFRERWKSIVGSSIFLVLGIINYDLFVDNFQDFQEKRTAKERYNNECLYLKSIAKKDKPANVTPNVPVINLNTNSFFSENTVVCDVYGGTAIIENKKLKYDYKTPNDRFTYEKGDIVPIIDPDSIANNIEAAPDEIPKNAKVGYIGKITNIRRGSESIRRNQE